MGRGGDKRPDPLVTKSGFTAVTSGRERYLCTFCGSGQRERIVEIGLVVNSMGDRNAANFAARKLCERGVKAFVAIDTEGGIYVAQELAPRESAPIVDRIIAERRGGQNKRASVEFSGHHGSNGCGPELAVDHTRWAEGVVERYLEMPVDTIRIDAVDRLPGLCGTDIGKRAALVTALHTVADLIDNAGHATVVRRVAGELEQGTLRL